MVDNNVLMEIKNAEKRAKSMLEKAASDNEELISEAKHTAVKLVADSKNNAKKKTDQMIARAEKRLKDEKERITDKCRKDALASKKRAESNLSSAEKFVIDKFIEKCE